MEAFSLLPESCLPESLKELSLHHMVNLAMIEDTIQHFPASTLCLDTFFIRNVKLRGDSKLHRKSPNHANDETIQRAYLQPV